jgi:hypothetical protein
MCCIHYIINQVTSLRAVQKEKYEQREANFRNRDGGQDRPSSQRARYLAIISMEGAHKGTSN